MPNWCENTLVVSGDDEEVKKFVSEAKGEETELSLANIYPEPDYKKELVKPTFPNLNKQEFVDPETSWWDWRIQHWGTKWDVDAELVDEDDGIAEYSFESAWSPPVEWLQEASRRFPKLEFRLKYDEPGMCFMGAAKAFAGELDDQTVEY